MQPGLLLGVVLTFVLVASMPGDSQDTAAQGETSVDPLPSWNDGEAKNAINTFVNQVTKLGRTSFVQVANLHLAVLIRRSTKPAARLDRCGHKKRL